MTPEELKNSILQLAIQGKLVEQRTEEGTAEELYQQILAEKQQLIKEGKIRKQKPLPEITEDETPFEIPKGWEWVRLGDIFINITLGGAKPKNFSNKKTDEFNIPLIANGIKNNGIVGYTSKALIKEEALLVYGRGSNVGKVNIINFPFTPIVNNIVLEFSNKTCLSFLYYVFLLMPEKSTGSAMPQLTKGVTVNKMIPLPPLTEQKRIVAKIEELLPYIGRYEQAWNELEELNKKFPDDLQKSILQLAIQGKLVEQRPEEGTAEELHQQIQAEKKRLIKEGKIKKGKPLPEITEDEIPFDIPESWKWASVGDTCTNIQYGTSQKSLKSGKTAVLRMGNIQDGKVDYGDLLYSSDVSDINKYILLPGDLLFNRTNSKELVGKTAIYKGDKPAIFAGYLIRITPVLLDSDYLNYVMQSQFYWTYCQTVRSDAIGQSNINAEKLKGFFFPLPPLAEQKRIVAKIEELLPLCEKLKWDGQAT
ncbi:MAG TPA: restriction endonuclease [Firmicutes bacterium]|nr:restriction endonuclease [Bacillota bacterium]